MGTSLVQWRAAAAATSLLIASLLVGQTAQAQGNWQMQRAQIIDRNGFGQPMVAATIMLPAGMKTQGGVRWRLGANECPQGHTFDWQAASPDGLWTVTIIPSERWGASSTGQPAGNVCNVAEVRSAKGYLEAWVSHYRKGARVLDFRDRPDLRQSSAQLNNEMNVGSMQSTTRADAGEVLIGYEQNGQALRESIAAVVVITESVFGGMGVGPDMRFLQGFSLPAFAMRAPAGQLNFTAMEQIRQTIQLAPEWSARINKHNQVMNRQNMDHSKKMHDIRMKHSRDMSGIINKGYKERSAAMDRSHREFIESIRGTETWNLPGGGTTEVEASTNAWQHNDGTIITSDQPGWRPADAGIDATRLQRTQ
ncbi:MAG: hypothetical protein AB8C46_18575 [Burkholderiaceae bacterium]